MKPPSADIRTVPALVRLCAGGDCERPAKKGRRYCEACIKRRQRKKKKTAGKPLDPTPQGARALVMAAFRDLYAVTPWGSYEPGDPEWGEHTVLLRRLWKLIGEHGELGASTSRLIRDPCLMFPQAPDDAPTGGRANGAVDKSCATAASGRPNGPKALEKQRAEALAKASGG